MDKIIENLTSFQNNISFSAESPTNFMTETLIDCTSLSSSLSSYNNQSDLCSNETSNETNADEEYVFFLDQSRFWIQRVLVPIIMIIGVIGNTITIVIMTRRRMRSSTNWYLAALATFDMLYLIFTFILSFRHYSNIKNVKYYYYWILWPFAVMICDGSSNTSIWLTVTFTIERYANNNLSE